ncbi:MAG: cell wall-binding repeat-containing protein [Lachnospiraceae bacterium]|nr:cell wall-binding repeat-containing protein [Lachnospiraceae bacterium]
MKKIRMILLAFMMIVGFSTMPLYAAEEGQNVTISSFVTSSMQEITVSEEETLEEVRKQLPTVLEATDQFGESINIPVFWECVGNYDETDYFYYQFKPVFDTDTYELAEGLELPYIWVLRASSENLSRVVTKSANETTIYNFLVNELGCNLATAVGILANIERESSFNPKAGASDGYYGICQWGASRLDDLKNYCSEKGYSYDSLEGQLNFLKHELYGTESRAWSKMQGMENSAEGAYFAGYNWARYFERCASVYREVSAVRARDVYWPNYVEEKTAPVYRISGSTRYETGTKIADQLKQVLGVEKFENIIVATGKGFADALSGSYLAYVKNAPIILTNGSNLWVLTQYIEKNLDSTGTIYLLGGESVIPKTVEEQLIGYNVKRLAGKTRYETNLEILKEAGGISEELLICTGKSFADSLSASASGKPILLVKDVLNDKQKTYLDSLEVKTFSIIGGENAVSTDIETELMVYGACNRIGGATRYETSVLVAKTFASKADTAILAYSKKFPDGLCGGLLAAKLNAPLILTMTGNEKAATRYISQEKIQKGFVLGGSGLISDDAVKKIFDLKMDSIIKTY